MFRGSCLCGAIVYRIAGPVDSASHCYCSMCRKQHGAAAGTYAEVASAALTVEQGEALITEYASSEHGRRSFCRRCGSALFWRDVHTPDRIEFTLGTLDTPFTEPVETELFADNKPVWAPMQPRLAS